MPRMRRSGSPGFAPRPAAIIEAVPAACCALADRRGRPFAGRRREKRACTQVRRGGPARDDRAGAVVPTWCCSPTSQLRARRNGADPDHPAVAPAAAGAWCGGDLCHSRRGRGDRGSRPHCGHVCRSVPRGRADRKGDRYPRASLHGRTAHLHRLGLNFRQADRGHSRRATGRALPAGCSFAARCRHTQERCRVRMPPESALAPGRITRCVRVADGEPDLGSPNLSERNLAKP